MNVPHRFKPARLARRLFLKGLESFTGGGIEIVFGDRTWEFGDRNAPLQATIAIHNERFFPRAVFGGDIAIGESWMDGDWSSPNLVEVVRLAIRNLAPLAKRNSFLSAVSRTFDTVSHKLRENTLSGSRRNISAHYDLSNNFFQLFLDRTMMYSCAYYRTEHDGLETAQLQKLDLICRKLRLGPDDHVLEIGTGWGGFAEYASRHYKCRITTTTISREQHAFARQRFDGNPGIELLLDDYRNLRGKFDKIVSIEMFEAVGLKYYDQFFSACDRLLKPAGSMCMQAITMNEQTFPAYRKRADWIQKYIFPGSELASISEILRSLARSTDLALYHAEDIGVHYARTLAAWRQRFHAAMPEVLRLGFDPRFTRMWDYYLAYCESAFLERHIGDFQLVLTKNHNPRALYQEPWAASEQTVSEFHPNFAGLDTKDARQ